jgi:hypothetical protein
MASLVEKKQRGVAAEEIARSAHGVITDYVCFEK